MAMQQPIDDNEAKGSAFKAGSNLERLLAAGHFAVTGELEPPKSHDAEIVRKRGTVVENCLDAANITDNQTAIVRMSSIGSAILLKDSSLEPVIQITCRDRNRLAMQADLLGAAAHGIKNVLCLSGDHQSFGNHPGAKNVHDIDSMQLIRMIKEMRDESRFQCGEEIPGGGPRFFIGAAANPFADPVELRPHRLAKKVAAGADFEHRDGALHAGQGAGHDGCRLLRRPHGGGREGDRQGGQGRQTRRLARGGDPDLHRAGQGNETDRRCGRRSHHGHRLGDSR
jgi:hypothetical protein